jgi:hypothetical protein
MEYLPDDVMYAVAEMKEVSRNRFKLETVSADTAGPNRICTFNLPENAMIDMKSLRFFFDVACTGSDANGTPAVDEVFGKLPQNASTLLSRVEVYINGVQTQQGASEYNTIAQALRLGRSNIDKDNSIDRALSHSYITADDKDDDESICVSEWCGFLGEASTRYLNTGLLGQIQIRLTFAGNWVLVPKQKGVEIGDPLSSDAKLNAALMKYSVSNMYFTVDSVSLDPMYNAMLRKRLEAGGLELNYKEYYSFQYDGIQSGTPASASTRFSLSSGCIDKLYALYRDSNYTTTGVPGHKFQNATGVSAYTANALRFRSYSGDTNKVGLARWNWSINNVKFPQYQASWIDGLADVSYAQDKVSHDSAGTLITSKESYNDGKFIFPLLLALPTGKGVAVQAGYNSRGINTQMVFQSSGQVVPVADSGTNSGTASCFVIAETTAKLMIQLGRDLAVQF